jgi:ribose transport system ATP-binding protein
VAVAVGTLNWALIILVKINPLIATLVTYTFIQGVAFTMRPLPGGDINPQVVDVVKSKVGFVPVFVILAVVVALALEFALRRSLLGVRLRALGSNPETARKVGVRSKSLALVAYVGCSVVVVPAAFLLMAQSKTGNATIGDSYVLASIAAVVLGGASLFGGRGSFLGAFMGAVLFIQINTVVQFLGLELYWQLWLLGGLTILAAAFYSKTRSLTERSWS